MPRKRRISVTISEGSAVKIAMIEREDFMRVASFVVLLSIAVGLAGCGQTYGSRAVTGGLMGAGAGAGVSALTGGRPATGAAIGGGAGALGGVLTK
jgi:osmotically inducible lipoprotein OsmB